MLEKKIRPAMETHIEYCNAFKPVGRDMSTPN
jgi:hypothetical protein